MACYNEKEVICRIEDLEELQCLEIDPRSDAGGGAAFIVKKNGAVHAYVNSCPHTGAPLNWQENQFLDLFKTHILCTVHGARFQIGDGLCIEGPCIGQRLKKYNTEIRNGRICRAHPSNPRPKPETNSNS